MSLHATRASASTSRSKASCRDCLLAKFPTDPAIGVVGIGSDTPEGLLTNADLESLVDTSDEWIVERTGIKSRRIADAGTTTSMLASRAARRALEDAGISPEEVDLIIVGTATPDMLFPSTGCLVQRDLG